MNKIEEDPQEHRPLVKHPFTQIQLSDREKFHTGMLKLTLDLFQKEAFESIFGTVFANELYTAEPKIQTCLEENSVDLSIKKDKKVFAIVESKFKTGLHYSNYNGEKVSQLEKYALNNPEVTYGFVVSLFPEEEEDLTISSGKKTKIENFAPLRYTVQVLDYLKANPYLKEDKPLHVEKDRWEKIQDDPSISLIALWKSYLEELAKIVGRFENNKDLKKITSDDAKLLSIIKLKGVFEGYRMNQVKIKLQEVIKDESELIKKLQDGAKVWKTPDAENNYIILGNTHGAASMSLVMTDEHESISYGIQWQAGSVKVFIQHEKKITSSWLAIREVALSELSKALGGPEINNKNKKSKFKSFTLSKKDVLTDDIHKMDSHLIKILKTLRQYPPKI